MRLAGQRLTGQLDDPNLPCKGESLLPTTKYADFEADPRERSRQELIAKKAKKFLTYFRPAIGVFINRMLPPIREHVFFTPRISSRAWGRLPHSQPRFRSLLDAVQPSAGPYE